MTDEPKIHGVAVAGEAPPTGGGGGQRQVTRGYPHAEESGVDINFHGYTEVLVFWAPCRICVFDVRFFYTDVEYYDGRHPQIILSQNGWHKKENALGIALIYDITSH